MMSVKCWHTCRWSLSAVALHTCTARRWPDCSVCRRVVSNGTELLFLRYKKALDVDATRAHKPGRGEFSYVMAIYILKQPQGVAPFV
jgi:hypothetical protein